MAAKTKISTLSPTQKYAAGALLALTIRQAQIHQDHPLGSLPPLPGDEDDDEHHSFPDDRIPDPCSSSGGGGGCSTDCRHLWTHPSRSLLRPVFRFLEIDDKAWPGLEETATSAVIKHHIGAYLRLILEDEEESSSERSEQQFALAKAVDAMAKSLEAASVSIGIKEMYHDEDEKPNLGAMPDSKAAENTCASSGLTSSSSLIGLTDQFGQLCHQESVVGDAQDMYQRKVSVLYELLSACVADTPEDSSNVSRTKRGYDARHRVALRLLATWLDVKWIKMEMHHATTSEAGMGIGKLWSSTCWCFLWAM